MTAMTGVDRSISRPLHTRSQKCGLACEQGALSGRELESTWMPKSAQEQIVPVSIWTVVSPLLIQAGMKPQRKEAAAALHFIGKEIVERNGPFAVTAASVTRELQLLMCVT